MMTRRAWAILGFSLLLYLLGANLQSGWVYLIVSLAMALLGVSWVVNGRVAGAARGARHAPPTATASVPFTVSYDIGLPAPHGTIIDTELGVRMPVSGAGRYEAEAIRPRGVYILERFSLATSYPFALFTRKVVLESSGHLIVFPDYDEIDIPLALSALWGSEAARAAAREGNEYAGVREYGPGDSYRLVHWKKTARGSGVFVKELALPERLACVVILDNRVCRRGLDEQFETMVSAAATVLRSLTRMGFETTLAYFERGHLTSTRGTFEEYLVLLAGIQPETGECVETTDPIATGASMSSSAVLVRSCDADVQPPSSFGLFRERLVVQVGDEYEPIPGSRAITVVATKGGRQWQL